MPEFSFQALYIHIPFCVRRCAYCDFLTEAIDRSNPDTRLALDSYVDQLIIAIRRASRAGLLAEVRTIYMGGGTPTALGASRLVKLVYTLSLFVDLSQISEFTVEANPDSFSEELSRDLFALGVTRFSFGVQSFDDKVLARLGRIHTSEKARTAICAAQERVYNISIDLICGIPGQSLSSWEADVREAIAAGVPHVSVYPLTIEEGTTFARLIDEGHLTIPDEDFQADCMEYADKILSEAGFVRYEVASYAKPGYESQHNLAYWHGVSYLGLGRGAAGMFAQSMLSPVISAQTLPDFPEADIDISVARVRYTTALDGTYQIETLTQREACAEDIMLAMRCTEGISEAQVRKASELLPCLPVSLQHLQDEGLIIQQQDNAHETGVSEASRGCRYIPTKKGWLMGNELFGKLWELHVP